MAWPYEFQTLSPEERQARRLVLDRYAHYAVLLVLAPVLGALCLRAAAWAAGRVRRLTLFVGWGRNGNRDGSSDSGNSGAYSVIPSSPSRKAHRDTLPGRWAIWLRQARWWLSDDVVLWRQTYGQRDQWVGGAVWMAVLLVLCVLETGRDYLHLTKRLGIVAISQFPFQYVLALKRVNPVAFALRSSHEQVNRWHRVLGVIVYVLLLAHSALYLNFFYYDGGILPRLRRPVIILGLLGIAAMTFLNATSLAIVRRASYRLFFMTHVAVVFSVPALIFFHAHAARPYLATSLLLLLGDLTLRKLGTVTARATVEPVPGSAHLVRLSVPIPQQKLSAFRKHPATHLYMSLPWTSRGGGSSNYNKGSKTPGAKSFLCWPYLLYEFVFNPFTVASVNESTGDLTLVVRTRQGPLTSVLAQAAGGGKKTRTGAEEESDGDDDETAPAIASTSRALDEESEPTGTLPVNIEGPYGLTTHMAALAPRNVDRVLLVAGGVGATFAVPLYRALVQASLGRKIDLVWSVRGAGDARWATAGADPAADSSDDSDRQNTDSPSLLVDPNVHIFLTSGSTDGRQPSGWLQGGHFRRTSAEETSGPRQGHGEEDMELASMTRRPATAAAPTVTAAASAQPRPDLHRIVDDVFRHGSEERVAVVVCGPAAMARDLRASVAPWVQKGRSVWWHNETFGW